MNELLSDNHPALNKWLYQLAECIVEGKPVSKKVLSLILGLSGFERGAVFLVDTENDFKLKLRLGGFKDIKAVGILCRRILDVRPNEIESAADLRKCRWVRNYQELRGSEILSYAYIPLLNEYVLAGFLYLDSTVMAQPDFDSEGNQLRRFSKLMMQALAHDGITSPEPLESSSIPPQPFA